MFYVISHANVGANYNTSQNIDSDTIGIYTVPAKHNSSGEDCIKGWCGTTNDIKTTAYGSFKSIEAAKAWVLEHYDVREVEDDQKPDHDDSVMLFKFGKYAPMSDEQIGEAFYEEIESVRWDMSDEELAKIASDIEDQANSEGYTAIDNLDLESIRDQKVKATLGLQG